VLNNELLPDYFAAVNHQSVPSPRFTSTAISEDGKRLVFHASTPAGDGNASVTAVYLYDATADAVTCLSCKKGEERDARFLPEADFRTATPRAISADGSRIAFTSNAALVPEDTNGVGDVYEYLDGEIHLISSGTSPFRSFFVGMSQSGDDLFFMTRDPLAASDTDGGQYDVYDARVDGGFAGGPTMTPPCAEDRCQGAPSVAIQPRAIASETPSGGNPAMHSVHKKHRKHKHKKKHTKSRSQQRAIENRRAHR